MNKLSQGIFEIDGFEYSRNTTLEEIKALGKYDVLGTGEVVIADSRPNILRFYGTEFVVRLYFSSGKLDRFELYPFLRNYAELKASGTAETVSFELCRDILDKNFDSTVERKERENGLVYCFTNGSAGIPYSEYNRDYSSGGYIFVSFRRDIDE